MTVDEKKLLERIVELSEEQAKFFKLIRERFERLEDRLAVLEAERGGQDAAAQNCTE